MQPSSRSSQARTPENHEAVWLYGWHNYSLIAEVDERTNQLSVRHRRLKTKGDWNWLPEVKARGYFDRVGIKWVAFYHDPRDSNVLWLLNGRRRYCMTPETQVEFKPRIDDKHPRLIPVNPRTICFKTPGEKPLRMRYCCGRLASRLVDGITGMIDPTQWPTSERDYDMLFHLYLVFSNEDGKANLFAHASEPVP